MTDLPPNAIEYTFDPHTLAAMICIMFAVLAAAFGLAWPNDGKPHGFN